MLEKYFIRPETIDRIRSSWIGSPIEQYVDWLTKNGYASRNIFRRVPILMHFGQFAQQQGATTWEELPSHIEAFTGFWAREHGQKCKTEQAREKVAAEARNPVAQMLRLVLADFAGSNRGEGSSEPFRDRVPGFFDYLRGERGLRKTSLFHYRHPRRSR